MISHRLQVDNMDVLFSIWQLQQSLYHCRDDGQCLSPVTAIVQYIQAMAPA
jgi:hypothetical protein